MYVLGGQTESEECTYHILDNSVVIKYKILATSDYYSELTFHILDDGKLRNGYDIYEKQ